MHLLFENKYIVSEESGTKYHSSAPDPPANHPVRKTDIKGNVMRVVGLTVSIFIILISLALDENIVLFIGLALSAMYIYRIFYSLRQSPVSQYAPPQMLPIELKWQRVIRFADKIIVDDPRYPAEYAYDLMIRITEDTAYYTLWFSDRSTMRIFKNGFTVGTPAEFKLFAEHVIQNFSEGQEGVKQ